MSVLCNETIEKLANAENGLFGDDFKKENLQGASYDLRIGTIYKKEEIISVERNNDKVIKINPSEIITMLTLEKVNIPLNLCATVFPINRMSSRGLLILNPGHIDPGYNGYITICAINFSRESIYISLKEKIFTIIFYQLDGNAKPFVGLFPLDNRLDIELEMFKNRASKLSPSIFDLITIKDYAPYLKEQISTVLNSRLSNRLIYWASTATIIALLVAIISFLASSTSKDILNIFNKNQNTTKNTTLPVSISNQNNDKVVTPFYLLKQDENNQTK